MIAVDTNILVHAHRAESMWHTAALGAVTTLAEGSRPWAIAAPCLVELVRVLTHPRVLRRPHTVEQARAVVEHLCACPSLRVLRHGERFVPLFLEAVADGRATGNLVFDAQIVALCREHGVRRLLTEDRDFARFRGIEAVALEAFDPNRA